MQLIVYEDHNAELFGLFCAHCGPGGSYYDLGRRKLVGREGLAVRQAMLNSVELVELLDSYLTT